MPEDIKPKSDPQQPRLPEPEVDKEAVVDRTSQALSRQPRNVRDLIQGPEFKAALKAVLPRAMRADRFVRVILTALMRNPKLLECTKESLFRCLLDLAGFGLEPDGRRAHLIPFKNKKNGRVECTLILDYKGIAELVRRSGEVSIIHADVVYEHDEWSYAYGTDGHLKHKPNLEDRGIRKIAYYSYVRLKDGGEDFVVLNPAEVESVRKRSKSPEEGPWVTDYDEMGKKTAFRRHSKWLPLSSEARDAIERDDEAMDISGWEELLEPEKPEVALVQSKRQPLKDRLMSEASTQDTEGRDVTPGA